MHASISRLEPFISWILLGSVRDAVLNVIISVHVLGDFQLFVVDEFEQLGQAVDVTQLRGDARIAQYRRTSVGGGGGRRAA